MAEYQPPPTWVNPIELNETTKEVQFEPNWLKWFLDLAQILTAVGAAGGGIDHNLLDNLQGGTTDQYYHLTSAQHGSITGTKVANTYFAGPASGADATPAFRAGVAADITFTATSRVLGRITAAGGKGEELTGTNIRTITGLATTDSPTFTGLTLSGLTADRVVVVTTAGLLATDNNLSWINASDILVVGHTASLTGWNSSTPREQISGSNQSTSSIGLYKWGANADGFGILGNTSRNATPGSHTIVQNGDYLNQLVGAGSDGTNFEAAAAIAFAVDGTPGSNDMPGRIEVYTTPDGTNGVVQAMRVDNAQRTILGTGASVTVGNAGRLQVDGTTDAASQIQVSRFSANASGPSIVGSKSRNATEGSNTIAQSGDVLLNIVGYGADGTNYDPAAAIRFEVDGTPGAGTDMPGRIVALTSPDGTATLTEAWRVDSAQIHIFQVDRSTRYNNQTSAAGAAVGTLNNSPTAGDPGHWLKINIGGTNYAIPCWAG